MGKCRTCRESVGAWSSALRGASLGHVFSLSGLNSYTSETSCANATDLVVLLSTADSLREAAPQSSMCVCMSSGSF